jgi:hypothetical protein
MKRLAFLVYLAAQLVLTSGREISQAQTNFDKTALDFYAGERFPFAANFDFSLPSNYRPDAREDIVTYSGEFEGNSHYKGDRRFNAFQTRYHIAIAIQSRSDVSVAWSCQQKENTSDRWQEEVPKMTVVNAKYGSFLVWGDMVLESKTEQKIATKPFIALFVERVEDNAKGILLLGRYEGPVFLARSVKK